MMNFPFQNSFQDPSMRMNMSPWQLKVNPLMSAADDTQLGNLLSATMGNELGTLMNPVSAQQLYTSQLADQFKQQLLLQMAQSMLQQSGGGNPAFSQAMPQLYSQGYMQGLSQQQQPAPAATDYYSQAAIVPNALSSQQIAQLYPYQAQTGLYPQQASQTQASQANDLLISTTPRRGNQPEWTGNRPAATSQPQDYFDYPMYLRPDLYPESTPQATELPLYLQPMLIEQNNALTHVAVDIDQNRDGQISDQELDAFENKILNTTSPDGLTNTMNIQLDAVDVIRENAAQWATLDGNAGSLSITDVKRGSSQRRSSY